MATGRLNLCNIAPPTIERECPSMPEWILNPEYAGLCWISRMFDDIQPERVPFFTSKVKLRMRKAYGPVI
jgi:hypothetical protein